MPPRANNGVDMLLAQAQEKLRELKELQFFGGDALNLKRWVHVINIPADAARHCYQIVITPQEFEHFMPFEAIIKPGNATTYPYGQVEAVHRTDGKYEYLIITGENYDPGTIPLKVTIEYTGVAAFSITQIG